MTERVRSSWGSAEGRRTRRCGADLVVVATVRFVGLADGLRSGRVPERSTEHVDAWREVAALARRTGKAGRARVDWPPVLHP